jgi:hypothetical protein
MKLMEQIIKKYVKVLGDKELILVERFVDGVRDEQSKRELRKFAQESAGGLFVDFRRAVLSWSVGSVMETRTPLVNVKLETAQMGRTHVPAMGSGRGDSSGESMLQLLQTRQRMLEQQQRQLNSLSGTRRESGQIGQAGHTGQSGQIGQAGHMGQSGQMGQAGHTGQSGQMGQAGHMGQSGQMGQAGHMGQSGQMGQAGQMGQPRQMGQPGFSGGYRGRMGGVKRNLTCFRCNGRGHVISECPSVGDSGEEMIGVNRGASGSGRARGRIIHWKRSWGV